MVFSKEHFTLKDEFDYGKILGQFDTEKPLTFGSPINVLLITNRLFGCAEGLKEYLQNSTDITVNLVSNSDDAIQIILERPIEFLILVGYSKDIRTYGILKFFKRANKYSDTILYTVMEDYVFALGEEHGIDYVCNRMLSVDLLIKSMRGSYFEQTTKTLDDHPEAAPEQAEEIRKQVRVEALAEISHGKGLAMALKRFIK